jgi:hypothetical protein
MACLDTDLEYIITVVQCIKFQTIQAFLEERDDNFPINQYEGTKKQATQRGLVLGLMLRFTTLRKR